MASSMQESNKHLLSMRSIIARMVPFLGFLLDQVNFPFKPFVPHRFTSCRASLSGAFFLHESTYSFTAWRFSLQYFLVLRLTGREPCSRLGLVQFLIILFTCYLSIQHSCYVLSVFLFFSKIDLFIYQPVVNLSCSLHQLVCRKFLFWNILLSFFFFFLLDLFPFVLKYPFFCHYLFIYSLHLCYQTCRRLFIVMLSFT